MDIILIRTESYTKEKVFSICDIKISDLSSKKKRKQEIPGRCFHFIQIENQNEDNKISFESQLRRKK